MRIWKWNVLFKRIQNGRKLRVMYRCVIEYAKNKQTKTTIREAINTWANWILQAFPKGMICCMFIFITIFAFFRAASGAVKVKLLLVDDSSKIKLLNDIRLVWWGWNVIDLVTTFWRKNCAEIF